MLRDQFIIQPLEARQLLAAFLPDLTFGDRGVIFNSEPADVVLVQSDNRFVTLANKTSLRKIFVSRHENNGQYDRLFADDLNNMATGTTVNGGSVLPDDRLLVTLTSFTSTNTAQIALLQHDGQRDPTFANNGIATIPFPAPIANCIVTSAKLVGIGKSLTSYYALAQVGIVNSQSTPQQAAVLLRIKTNGMIDTTFGKNGFRTIAVASSDVKARPCLAIDHAGRIHALVFSNTMPQLMRFTSAGNNDTSFAGTGKVNLNFVSTLKQPDIAMQSNGSIIVGAPLGEESGLWRITSTGVLDENFGDGGEVEMSPNDDTGDVDVAGTTQMLRVLSDDRIVAVDGGGMYRFNANGSPDLTFDADGQAAVPYTPNPVADSLGRLLINGDERFADRAIATLVPDGTLYIQGDDLPNSIGLRYVRSSLRVSSTSIYNFPISSVKDIQIDMRNGNDLLTVSSDIKTEVDLGAGDDSIYISSNFVTINGGAGNDTIVTGAGNDLIMPDAGNDSVDSGDGNDTILDGLNIDSSTQDNDFVNAGAGNDVVKLAYGNNTVWGGDGDDSIRTGDGNDSVLCGMGNDYARTAGGNDSIDGGGGRDQLIGGLGNDLLVGGSSDDTLIGGPGLDTLYGSSGNDLIIAYDTTDTLSDIIDPGTGTDTVYADTKDTHFTAEIIFNTPFLI